MGLNIKNEETLRPTRELARLTGETMSAAVTEAVRQRLDRLHREQGVPLADRLLEIGRDCAAHLKEPRRSADHGELLCDERGMPPACRVDRQSKAMMWPTPTQAGGTTRHVPM